MKRQTRRGGGWACLGGRLTPLTLAAALCPVTAGAGEGAVAAGQTIAGVEVIGQVTLSLMLVVAVLLVLAWALRRLGRFQSQSVANLRVLEGIRLGTRERILLVQAWDRRLLVGVSPGGLRTLLVFDEATGRQASEPAETAFSVKEFP